jgi:hypothetical protein
VVQYRNRHHRKVSALGAIALAADGTLSVLIDWHPATATCVDPAWTQRGPEALALAQRLLKEVPGDGPIDLVWGQPLGP